MKTDNSRSPLFYMGDKFKLLDQLKEKFPKEWKEYSASTKRWFW